MAKIIGRQQQVGISRESTRGTLVVPTFWVPKVNFDVEDKVLKTKFNGNYGVLAGGDDAPVTQKWAEGMLEMEATDKILGLLLYGLFGSLSSATFNGAKKHTLSIQNSTQPTSLSLFMNDSLDSVSVAYALSMINSAEFTFELGELVKTRFNFIAKAHKDFTSQTPSYAVGNKFAHQNLNFKVAANTAALDAASKINLQSLTLRIERSVVRENALGTVQPVDILARAFKISGSLKLTYQDRTYRDYMLNNTQKAVRIDVVKSDTTIGTTNPSFRFDLPLVHFDQWQPSYPLEEIATQEINFEALYDVANSQLISDAYVVNEQTSY